MKEKIRIKKSPLVYEQDSEAQDPQILVSSQPINYGKLPFGMLTSPFITQANSINESEQHVMGSQRKNAQQISDQFQMETRPGKYRRTGINTFLNDVYTPLQTGNSLKTSMQAQQLIKN